MRRVIAAFVLSLALAAAVVADGPSYKATVARARAAYDALSGRQRAFCVVNRTAWELRREGAGLFFKTGPNGFAERSSDIVMFLPDGRTFDVLGDAEGRAVPAWAPTQPTGRGDIAKWRAPVDPATAQGCTAVQPPVTPDPPPVTVCPVCPLCPPDQATTVATLRAGLAAMTADRDRVSGQLQAMNTRLVESEQAVAALHAKLTAPRRCRGWVPIGGGINIPARCEVLPGE